MAREMKDSGTKWLGFIPENWEVTQIGYIYAERRMKVSDIDYPPLSVTMKGIVPQLSTAAKTDAHDDRKLVCKNDFVINSRSDRRGSCGISALEGSVSLINTVLMPRVEMNPRYYNWLFHTAMFADEFYKWGHGIVDDLWTTGWQDMKKIIIPAPALSEQESIAEYLDVRCSAIDRIIEQSRQAIEEYKAFKQAVITEAVTKGVRGDRPMKDSGVEWIGRIPIDWNILKFGAIATLRNGYVGPTRDLFQDAGVCYIQSLHIKDGKINFGKQEYYVSEDWAKQHPKIHTNDLLIVQTGDIGQVGLVPEEYNNCNCHALIIAEPKLHHVVPRYLMYYLLSYIGKELLLYNRTGALLPHLNSGKAKFTPIILPTISEQQEIIAYLDAKCAKIETLISVKQRLLAELESYKKSVIYEYVTGKKEASTCL